MTTTDEILHLVDSQLWNSLKHLELYSPASLSSEGFVHFSTWDTYLRSAQKHFAAFNQLLVLRVNSKLLTAELKFEAVEDVVFPHLYGPMNVNAVVSQFVIRRNSDGKFHR